MAEFHKHTQNGGVRPRCKACRSAEWVPTPEYNRAYYVEHKERLGAQMREWRATNREQWLAGQKAYREANREQLRSKTLMRNYGITLEQWHEIFTAQGKVCRICGSDAPKNKRGWHTDHGVTVRGILCHHCNTGLGAFNHDVAWLKAAIRYLSK